MHPPLERVWVIQGSTLLALLIRAHQGEDPDMLMMEMYANSEEGED